MIKGWRAWLYNDQGRLTGITKTSESWARGVNRAICSNGYRDHEKELISVRDEGEYEVTTTRREVAPYSKQYEESKYIVCTCGIYAVKDLSNLHGFLYRKEIPYEKYFFGEVEMWGKVVHHTRGYRAQYARVSSLFTVSENATHRDSFSKTYGVPVFNVTEHKELMRELFTYLWRLKSGR